MGNKYSPTVVVVPLTKQTKSNHMPTHVSIYPNEIKGSQNYNYPIEISVVLCEQILTVDKKDLIEKVGWVDFDKINQVNIALLTSIGIDILLAEIGVNVATLLGWATQKEKRGMKSGQNKSDFYRPRESTYQNG